MRRRRSSRRNGIVGASSTTLVVASLMLILSLTSNNCGVAAQNNDASAVITTGSGVLPEVSGALPLEDKADDEGEADGGDSQNGGMETEHDHSGTEEGEGMDDHVEMEGELHRSDEEDIDAEQHSDHDDDEEAGEHLDDEGGDEREGSDVAGVGAEKDHDDDHDDEEDHHEMEEDHADGGHSDEDHSATSTAAAGTNSTTTAEENGILELSTIHIHDADVYTQSGYDTEMGSDAICWVAPNHLKGVATQLTVDSEGLDDHMDHAHRRRGRRMTNGGTVGGSRESTAQGGTRYYVDDKGRVKMVSPGAAKSPTKPSLKRTPVPERRSLTSTSTTGNVKAADTLSNNKVAANINKKQLRARRQQGLPSWMTEDFVNEAKDTTSQEEQDHKEEGEQHEEVREEEEEPGHSEEDGAHEEEGMDVAGGGHNDKDELHEEEMEEEGHVNSGDEVAADLDVGDHHSDEDHSSEEKDMHSHDHSSEEGRHHDDSLAEAIESAKKVAGSFWDTVASHQSDIATEFTGEGKEMHNSHDDGKAIEGGHDHDHSDETEAGHSSHEDGEDAHSDDAEAGHSTHEDGEDAHSDDAEAGHSIHEDGEDDHSDDAEVEQSPHENGKDDHSDDAEVGHATHEGEEDGHSDDAEMDGETHGHSEDEWAADHQDKDHHSFEEKEAADSAHHYSDDHSDETDDEYDGLYSYEDGSFAGRRWDSPLVPNFIAGHTSTLPKCPHGLTVHVDGPEEMSQGEVLRTGQTYKFRLRAEVWLSDLRAEYSLDGNSYLYSSDDGKAMIGVQIIFCPAGTYCTPFIYQHGTSSDDEDGEHSSHDHRYLQHLHSEDEEGLHSEEGEEGEDGNSHEDGEHGSSHDLGLGDHSLHLDMGGHDSHDDGGDSEHRHITSEILLLEFTDSDQEIFLVDFEKEVKVDFPGSFVPLGHIQFFLTNGTVGRTATDDDVVFKIDTANTLHQGVVTFQSPARINKVGRGTEIFSYIAIILVGALEAFLLFNVIKHRNHSVIKLSQGIFLVVCLLSALVASTTTFLFNPKSDVYCLSYGPLIMIPLQIMLAVIIGRLHRIIAVMTPLMTWQEDQYNRRGKSKSKRRKKIGKMLPSWANARESSNSSKSSRSDSSGSLSSDSSASDGEGGTGIANNMRRRARHLRRKRQKARSLKVQFSERRLWGYIALLTLPQIIIQIIGLVLYPARVVVMFNADESVGRQQCYNDDAPNYQYAEYGVLFFSLFYLLVQSQRTKRLPSLFDEAESIAAALVSGIVATAIGIAVIAVSNEPTSSADVRYLMMMAIVMVLTINMSYRLVMPKLRLIWQGENVAVTQILSKHKEQSLQHKQTSKNSSSGSRLPQDSMDGPSLFSSDLPPRRSILRSGTSETSINGNESGSVERKVKKGHSRVSFSENADVAMAAAMAQRQEQSLKIEDGETHGPGSFDLLELHRPVPKSLMVTCVEHAEIVERVNRRLLSGLQVGAEEWEELRKSSEAMSRYFNHGVRFAWEGQA